MPARILDKAFDPWRELSAHQAMHGQWRGRLGATAVFVGSMRDFNQGTRVSAMTLEHYPEMTGPYLERLCESAKSRWALLDALAMHRVGPITPDEVIVLVAVWAEHREPAFAACRYIVEELKARAPFWKKEHTPAGERWVEHSKP